MILSNHVWVLQFITSCFPKFRWPYQPMICQEYAILIPHIYDILMWNIFIPQWFHWQFFSKRTILVYLSYLIPTMTLFVRILGAVLIFPDIRTNHVTSHSTLLWQGLICPCPTAPRTILPVPTLQSYDWWRRAYTLLFLCRFSVLSVLWDILVWASLGSCL